MTSETSPPIDPQAWGELLALGGEDAGVMIEELVTMYLEDGEALLQAIRQHQAAGDAKALGRSAHALRSPSATLGALRLAELCQQVELACGHQPEGTAAQIPIEAVVKEGQRVISALQQRLDHP
ncbi:Hpt domain-containing protein [Cyanobium sp. Morenito 9A2]|uniref:Hpt domain-containing protein n=1 Tax=Cyanobium sp. Morenito 9A2 TaxID=2823718 RepID=UPI0020CF645D|nr:Hpt domain-containing protein [Cyanobium sp. Morenito 9A2]MCP9849416.1 Hpt domain-containing protein [Cyanobium sp. Morenito 9A2]